MSDEGDASVEPVEGEDRGRVAARLMDLLAQLFGEAPALEVTGWDGSRAGAGTIAVHLTSRRALRRVLWAPGEMGLVRAYIAEELDVDGDLAEAVSVLRDFASVAARKGALSPANRRELLRATVVLGAVGPAPRAPSEPLDAVQGYAAVDEQMREVLPVDLAATILGAPKPPPEGVVQARFVTYPDPLSAAVRRWEEAGVLVRSVLDAADAHGEELVAWGARLDEHWDAVVEVVGERQARVWRISLVLDGDNLRRGRVRVYRAEGSYDGVDDGADDRV